LFCWESKIEKNFLDKSCLVGRGPKASDLEFDFDFHFQSDLKVNFCFLIRNPYYWSTPNSERAWNFTFGMSFEWSWDRRPRSCQLQIFNRKFHFLPSSRKEQVDLTMTLKSMLDSRELPRLSHSGCLIGLKIDFKIIVKSIFSYRDRDQKWKFSH